jgi:pimeloyl-ACP methyl ester carboxylesterase
MILDYKGSQVFYSDEGQGDAIVLLHGFLENSTMWQSLITHFITSFRVICVDLLGHGHSGCIGYIHTMEDMADAVHAVLNELKIKKFTLIGHSMGGYVALAYIERYQGYVNGLCLMNSTALEDNSERKSNRDRAIEAVKKNYKTFVSMSIANLFAANNRERFKNEIELVKMEALKTPIQGIIAALEGMKIRPDRTFLLKSIKFKKLIILGRKDPVLEYNTLMNQNYGLNAEITVFPDGHMSHIENKEELTYKLKHFIEN